MTSPNSLRDPRGPTAGGSRTGGPAGAGEAGPVGAIPTGPAITLPKGGGAIRNIGEKFAAHAMTGAGGMSVPIPVSGGRAGVQPDLALEYDSGAGNGLFGLGWRLTMPTISRRTDRGIPRYRDETDTFLLTGEDDLVPVLAGGAPVVDDVSVPGYSIARYRPRTEGSFTRIERWTRDDGDTHWRTLSGNNVLGVYGRDATSRIDDPADPGRVFSWLLCETRDDRGNAILFGYKPEDSTDVDVSRPHERGRGPTGDRSRTANRYLKWVRYGNTVPLLDADGRRPIDVPADLLAATDWLFEVVFDYGEHDADRPTPGDTGAWLARNDPFSTYRAGFEIRTYRLCQRVLMFHHFPDEPGVGVACLVTAVELSYRNSRGVPNDRRRGNPVASFLDSVVHRGYARDDTGGYRDRALPPVSFGYSEATIARTVRELDPDSVVNLPVGVDSRGYQWVDLDGEGLSGVLSDQAEGLFYRRNLGGGRLGPMELVATRPSLTDLGPGRQRLVDLAGNGELSLVQLGAEPAGFFRRTDAASWSEFRPFTQLPPLDWSGSDLLLLDLTGDGRADVLLPEDNVFTWHPSLAEAGFGRAERTAQPDDERRGPRLLRNDGGFAVFLADMSGDGLTDLVRIGNGEICYWPNLGYGRFGAKVIMDSSPWFAEPDQFDPAGLRLADVDGLGVTDLFYIGADGVRLWANEAGNGWAAPRLLADLPHLDRVAWVAVTDLLGNGTACLVWSSPLPADAGRPVRYLDLMGGTKPHLLTRIVNNLGGETTISYAASTKFYLADRRAGHPWATRLPFPVHVVERVESVDRISGTRTVSTLSYHHGHFDGVEREFRGFARVERMDAESFVDYVVGVAATGGAQDTTPELFQPPVTTRSWYHVGARPGGAGPLLHQQRDEYFLGRQDLPEPALPAGLTAEELRECVRAWRGLPLREEVYCFDGSAVQEIPYGAVEHTYDVRVVQAPVGATPAVCLRAEREVVTLSYERDPVDPRVSHQLNLTIDPYGNVLAGAAVVYGRGTPGAVLPTEVTAEQQRTVVTYGLQDYTPVIDQTVPVPAYRLPVTYEARGHELTGLTPSRATPSGARFTRDDLLTAFAGAGDLDYEELAPGLVPQRRLVGRSRAVFRDNTLAVRPAGLWDTLALPYESYQLALSPSVVATGYDGRVSDADLTAAGYVHLDGDPNWWVPSGVDVYPSDPATHFYLPTGARDPFGLEISVTPDRYHLLVDATMLVQAAWSRTGAVNDYRVLGPVLVTDANQRRTAVRLDELGMVVAVAVMGRAGAGEGDTLADPTTRFEYDLDAWRLSGRPTFARSLAREQHGVAGTRFVESYTYSTGSGGVAMVKTRTHPGRALRVGDDGTAVEVDADPRWLGTGRTIVNNKGNPVKQYEPYFSTTHEYEDEKALRELGSTPVRYFDPLGRNVLTRFPDGTLSRIEFDAWQQRAFDANDTVLDSQWYVERGSPDPAVEPEPVGNPQRRSAWVAAKHAATPAVVHVDSLGRVCYTVADYGGGVTAATRTWSDLTGRFAEAYDQLQRRVADGFAAMHGAPIWARGAEKGKRWLLQDVRGGLVRAWDEHGRELTTLLDGLRRPVGFTVRESGAAPRCLQYTVFGDRHPNATALGINGMPHLLFDQAGRVQITQLDFKGNVTEAQRTLTSSYVDSVDWSAVAAAPDYAALGPAGGALLNTEVFTAGGGFDALNRPIRITLPDATVLQPSYKEGGALGRLQVQVRGQGAFIDVLRDQEYDAKGQRVFAHYGNDLVTRYFHDPTTFRLERLLTAPAGAGPGAPGVRDLAYTYDPSGNITDVVDPLAVSYYNNTAVAAASSYEYDALYQLVRATGRELSGGVNDSIRDHGDVGAVPAAPAPNDANAVRNYTETYTYDLLGNVTSRQHRFRTQAGVGAGWTCDYRYSYQDNPADPTNRLSATRRPGDPAGGPYSATYAHDNYGNMSSMPHLSTLDWNASDQLRHVSLGGGGDVHYRYGAGGERVRKVIDRNGSLQLEWIFLGAVTLFRRRNRVTGVLQLERWTVDVSDDVGLIAQVDTKTVDPNLLDPANPLDVPLIRYQHTNHLGSAVLETDAAGAVISYEEYHPYGTSAYRYGKPGVDLSLKRFRFGGHELDDETGLYYAGARYYAPWLGRWTSSDPAGFIDGANLFRYCRNSPVSVADPSGTEGVPTSEDIRVDVPVSGQQAGRPTVKDFRSFVRTHGGGELDPRVTDENADIGYVPNARLDQESGGFVSTGGGTWVLRAHLSGQPAQKPSPPPAPAAIPAPSLEGIPPAGPSAPRSPDSPSTPAPASTAPGGIGGVASTQLGPAGETFIWEHPFAGIKGGMRGKFLEYLYGVPWRSNTKDYDLETATKVQQLKSVANPEKAPGIARSGTRDANAAIGDNPTGTMAGKQPQAVILTRTETSPEAVTDIEGALAPGPNKKIPPNSAPPEVQRGIPGRPGKLLFGLAGIGVLLSGFALYGDIGRKDAPMAFGDLLGLYGAGFQIHAAYTGVKLVTGISSLKIGGVLGGVSIAITSGVSAYRAYNRPGGPDWIGVGLGVLGVIAGVGIVAATIAGAPAVVFGLTVFAFGLGLVQTYRHFSQ